MNAPSRDRSVLLVEDDQELSGALRLVLEARGMAVEVADTAGEAVSRLGGDTPGAVVTDLGLPDLSGPDVVRRIRSAAPDARLVALTGDADEETRRRCVDAGADAYLVKPVSGRDLADYLTAG